jgi:hypothetical protein
VIYERLGRIAGFYYMDADLQKELIDIEVLAIKQRIQQQKAMDVDFSELLSPERELEEAA